MRRYECDVCLQNDICEMKGQPDFETPVPLKDNWTTIPGETCQYFLCRVGWKAAFKAFEEDDSSAPLVPFGTRHKPFVPGVGRFIARRSVPSKGVIEGGVYVFDRGRYRRVAQRRRQR